MPTLEPGSRLQIIIPTEVDGAGAGAYPTDVALTPDGLEFDPDTATWYPCQPYDADNVQILIGDGGTIDPAPGTYDIRTRITAPPETPILRAGPITIL